MRFVVAFFIAIVWSACLIASALVIDANLVGNATEFTIGLVDTVLSVGVVAFLVGIVTQEITL